MQTVDVTKLEHIGLTEGGPWLIDDGRVLRTSAHGLPLRTQPQAREVFDAYQAACDAGAGTPRPLEVVKAGEGFGVVVERVPGLNLLAHIAFGSYSPREAGEVLGALMREMHGLRCASARDVRAAFSRHARQLAPFLPSRIAGRLVPLVDAIPSADALLHGDVHVANVVVSAGEPRLIDLELCGRGHPVFDLAIARTRLLLNDNAFKRPYGRTGKTVAQVMWEACLRSYFQGAPSGRLEEMERRVAVLAEVEHCCFKCGIGDDAKRGLTDRQRARVELCVSRLDALLFRIDRLEFAQRA